MNSQNKVVKGMCRQAPPSYNSKFPIQKGIEIKDFTIEPEGYRQFLEAANYSAYKYKHHSHGDNNPVFIKKSLEHYIALELLDISYQDTYIDVANCDSPTWQIYSSLKGCRSFVQDLIFPKGFHGNKIGGDAANMPIEDKFASKMGLHSSFEHFEGDADSRFIRECERVLKPGGKVCIVEFFVAEVFANLTDPNTYGDTDQPVFDNEATIFEAENWRNRFGRFYDWPAFSRRIVPYLGNMTFTMYNVTNAKEFHPTNSIVRAAVLQKV